MEYFDLITHRTSSRVFTEEQITDAQLEAILTAARHAPVGSSRFKDVILSVVQDRAILDKLAEAAIIRHGDLEEMAKVIENVANRDELLDASRSFDPFYGAPTVIFLSHKKQDIEPGIQYANVGGMVNYMHLAALDLGLGSCLMWYALDSMRRLPEYDHTKLLGIPDDFETLMGLAVGNISKPLPVRDITLDRIAVKYIK